LHRWRLQHRGHRGWHTGTSDQPPFPGSTTICVTMNDHGIRTVYWQALQLSQGLRHKTLLIHCTQLHWDSALCKTNMILETTLKWTVKHNFYCVQNLVFIMIHNIYKIHGRILMTYSSVRERRSRFYVKDNNIQGFVLLI
jgi:hypothetical protein